MDVIKSIKILGQEREIILTRKKIKNINIKVKRDLKIYVNAPLKLSNQQIQEYLVKITPWLEKAFIKQTKLANSSSKVLLFGNDYGQNLTNVQIKKLLDKNIGYIEEIVEEVLVKLNLKNVTFKYRFMKSRWGSCNYKQRIITLNKYLIHFDENIVKSVICHEIAHLYVPNHSKDFYNVLSQMDPYYKKHRLFLKNHLYVLN